jgi:non-ribosomal peptide synthetase component F
MLVGGDRLDPQDVQSLRQNYHGKLFNAYGPTEITVYCSVYEISQAESFPSGQVPIGQAATNAKVLVVDSKQRVVPLGVVGEIVVTGDGVARGYTDPERDIDRFVTITLNDKAGEPVRAYRTGDYGRYRPRDGQLEYLGRIDGQVKIRGQRVELGEIEHILLRDSIVSETATTIYEDEDGAP